MLFRSWLEQLAIMSKTRTTVHASVQFVDIAGLVEGAAHGEGLGNRFLSHIREVDAIVYVLRAFENDDVPGSADPLEQLSILETELTLSDFELVDRLIDKRRKAAKNDRSIADEVAALEAARDLLAAGTPLYRSSMGQDALATLSGFSLLTAKGVLALVNLDESQMDDPDPVLEPVAKELDGHAEVIGLSIQLEAEAAMLEPESRLEMLEALGLGEGALGTFLHSAYQLLGLRTFFTTGEKETRAWTFRAGARAPQAAGIIHTDFERGFIRAETIRWDELLELGSWSAARDAGKLRIEGKDYVVADGDVMEFRFNV